MTFEVNKKHPSPSFRELTVEETEMVSGGTGFVISLFVIIILIVANIVLWSVALNPFEIKRRH